MNCEEDQTIRSMLIGMLREVEPASDAKALAIVRLLAYPITR
jgi:hypothetical protein